jgi:hypothetical protein
MIGLWVARACCRGLIEESDTQTPRDDMSQLFLQAERVLHLAVERLRPEVEAVRGTDQLGSHTKAVPPAAQAALDQLLDTESSPKLASIEVHVLEIGRGRARDDAQLRSLAEHGDQIFGQAIAQNLGRFVAVEICKWQHDERGSRLRANAGRLALFRCRRAAVPPLVQLG